MELPTDWRADLDYIDRLISGSGDERRLDPYEFDFATAADELRVLAGDARRYSKHASDSWSSNIADLRCAQEWVGPLLQRILRSDWLRLSKALRNLPLSNAAEMESRRATVHSLCESLTVTMNSGPAMDAAWRDLIQSVGTSYSYAAACKRRDLFVSVAIMRGYRFDRFGGSMRSVGNVLADSQLDVHRFRSIVEGVDGDESGYRPGLAGVPLDERLLLVSRYLSSDLPTPDNIVWLKYRRGLMADLSLTAGQVTFFRADWLASVIDQSEDLELERLPDEIKREPAEFNLFLRPPAEHGDIVARVQVGRELESKARQRAELVAESVLAASVGVLGRVGWSLTGTTLHFADGQVISSSWGVPERSDHRFWDYEPPLDISAVSDWVPKNSSVIAITDELEWTLDSIKAVSSSSDSSPSARLAVAVQAIERVDAMTLQLGSWSKFVKDILSDQWIISEMINDLENAILFASSAEVVFFAPQAAGMSAQIVQEVNLRHGWGRLSGVGLGDALISDSIGLLKILDPASIAHARLRWHARAFSQSKSLSHLHSRRESLEHLVSRIRRYRNAAVHGGSQSIEVIEYCADFARRIAGRALSWKLVSHLRGGDAAQTIRDLAAIESWRANEIADGRFRLALGPPPERLLLKG